MVHLELMVIVVPVVFPTATTVAPDTTESPPIDVAGEHVATSDICCGMLS